jgi:murein L,D-transpeptidase YafK
MLRYFTILLLGLSLTFSASPFLLAYASIHATSSDDNPLYFSKLPDSILIDSIAVHKEEREMLVFHKHQLVKIYRIQLGLNPVGRKQVNGDFKTPEGLYHITSRNKNSLFHKSLGISYPNTEDVARAKRLGKSPGGDIVIHGLPNRDKHVGPDRYRNDWTWGCIAVRNEEIDELFNLVLPGTPILITP